MGHPAPGRPRMDGLEVFYPPPPPPGGADAPEALGPDEAEEVKVRAVAWPVKEEPEQEEQVHLLDLVKHEPDTAPARGGPLRAEAGPSGGATAPARQKKRKAHQPMKDPRFQIERNAALVARQADLAEQQRKRQRLKKQKKKGKETTLAAQGAGLPAHCRAAVLEGQKEKVRVERERRTALRKLVPPALRRAFVGPLLKALVADSELGLIRPQKNAHWASKGFVRRHGLVGVARKFKEDETQPRWNVAVGVSEGEELEDAVLSSGILQTLTKPLKEALARVERVVSAPEARRRTREEKAVRSKRLLALRDAARRAGDDDAKAAQRWNEAAKEMVPEGMRRALAGPLLQALFTANPIEHKGLAKRVDEAFALRHGLLQAAREYAQADGGGWDVEDPGLFEAKDVDTAVVGVVRDLAEPLGHNGGKLSGHGGPGGPPGGVLGQVERFVSGADWRRPAKNGGGKSRFRGVSYEAHGARPWAAQIYAFQYGKCQQILISYFAREEDAARAYDRVSIAKLGHAQAKTNFPVAEYRAEWAELEALGVDGTAARERQLAQ